VQGGITHLQNADDIIILIQNNDLKIANMKFLLLCFEQPSRLKIIFHKSEVFFVMDGDAQENARVANLLNCQCGKFPLHGFPHCG
jgi:hypothetical protein